MSKKKKDDKVRRLQELGALHDLLLRASPADKKGNKSIPGLAKALSLSNWAVYQWISTGRLPPKRAKQIIEISNGEVTLDDVLPHIFHMTLKEPVSPAAPPTDQGVLDIIALNSQFNKHLI